MGSPLPRELAGGAKGLDQYGPSTRGFTKFSMQAMLPDVDDYFLVVGSSASTTCTKVGAASVIEPM